MGFLAPALLFGLAALAVPPIVHLLNRRRFEVVDWAAMRFLQSSERTRKRIFLEQFLLMLLRMGMILLLVLGVASPWLKTPWLAKIAPRPSRDVVIVLDGSFSMGYVKDGSTADAAAREWANRLLGDLQAGDRVAVVHARQAAVPLLPHLSSSPDPARGAIRDAKPPRGGANMPAAVREAIQILKTGGGSQRDVVVLTDGQRHGWNDPKSLERWELLANGTPPEDMPGLWVVNVVPDRGAGLPNTGLSPITSTRAVVAAGREKQGREVKFTTEVQLHGTAPAAPANVNVFVDGRPVGKVAVPGIAAQGRIPLTVTQSFATPGSHLLTLTIDDDAMPGDNRQDFALEVVPNIPVLIVDREGLAAHGRSSDFLKDALAPALDTNPSFLVRVVSAADFTPDLLTKPLGREPSTVPRVVIFCNVPSLRPDQGQAVEAFLAAGGGVLVTLGPRAEPLSWNNEHFRDGRGWLPARVVDPVGDEADLDRAARVVKASLESPALELFKNEEVGSLAGSAYFPRHWKLEVQGESGASAIALLDDRTPLFVEKGVGKGRVIQSAVPLDDSWRTNLTDLGDFVRLTHELAYYLASAKAGDVNLEARQPIVFRPSDGELPGPVTLQPPDGPSVRLPVKEWPMVFEETRDTGVYKLTTDTGKVQYFVVSPGAGESDLATATDEDRETLMRLVPGLKFPADRSEILTSGAASEPTFDLWWLLLLAVVLLLAGELWMTRRIAGAN